MIPFSIITINNFKYKEERKGVIFCFDSKYNENRIKSWINFFSGIPKGEIKQL